MTLLHGQEARQNADDVFCKYCKLYVQLKRAKLMSKQAMTWRCGHCNVILMGLYRQFGSETPDGWCHIPDEEQVDFFRTCQNAKQVTAKATLLLHKYEEKQKTYESMGTFKPLSAWEKDGYDSIAIRDKSRPEDTLEHPILGMTYRVPLITTGNREMKGTRREVQMSAQGKKRKLEQAEAGSGSSSKDVVPAWAKSLCMAPAADGDAAKAPSSSGSSSESSSSSSSRKKKKSKKGKKSKKSKKNKKNKGGPKPKPVDPEKERQKEKEKLAKENTQALSLATAASPKIALVLMGMRALSLKAAYHEVPAAVLNMHKKCMHKMQSMDVECQATINSGGNTKVSFTSKDLSGALGEAKRAQAVATGIVAQIENLSS